MFIPNPRVVMEKQAEVPVSRVDVTHMQRVPAPCIQVEIQPLPLRGTLNFDAMWLYYLVKI